MIQSPSGKKYIGITTRTIELRWLGHRHFSKKRNLTALQQAIKKYGADNFLITILAEENAWIALCAMEIAAIAEHRTMSPHGYNLTRGGEGVPGFVPTDEDRARTSSSTRAGMAHPDVKARLRACAQARAADPEWRAKVSRAKRGVKVKPASEQRKRLISEARKREWADPVIRQRRLAAAVIMRKGLSNPDIRKKASATGKSKWADPIYRAAMLASFTAARQREKNVRQASRAA